MSGRCEGGGGGGGSGVWLAGGEEEVYTVLFSPETWEVNGLIDHVAVEERSQNTLEV